MSRERSFAEECLPGEKQLLCTWRPLLSLAGNLDLSGKYKLEFLARDGKLASQANALIVALKEEQGKPLNELGGKWIFLKRKKRNFHEEERKMVN